ncbi:hypothetical protein BU23DRAFT_477821 [Bimuria novae-zelandiae CBS 107.79]|uniref:Kinesin light chain n=1 Tax=Bimuria novae-zelandiae CBS 107.79 TaxID=1447943 RepID=A0A6A5UXM6_9PLEO|nr:hypothetical protein BU23DRAFT_477821 [Bimuria novae-zelandiae CBS 107.79]
MANLVSVYRRQGRWKEAEELGEQVMETRKRVQGETHPDTLDSMDDLVFIWKGQDRNEEAIAMMKECVRLRERVIGPDHQLTSDARTVLNNWERENLESASSDI